jgi:hypothetical protein
VTINAETDEQRRRIEVVSNDRDAAVTKAATLTQDLQIIATSLRDEALRRDWCGEYGDWIEGVNSLTSEPWLKRCEAKETRRFIVDVEVTARSVAHINDAVSEVVDNIERAAEDLSTETESVTITYRQA